MLWVSLDKIRANPWQTRARYDPDYVAELAADIQERRASRPETKGLLQVPTGRAIVPDNDYQRLDLTEAEVQHRIDSDELVVQLVYGHHRWKAFERLATQVDGYYTHMPVDLVWFDDEEMATAAWSENYQRRDMTPMEEAHAIALMMEDFGWNQQRVGERLGLSKSTVSNKLRLLRLPVELRTQVQEGQVSERQAMAIAPLAELPAAAVESMNDWDRRAVEKLLATPGEHSSDELRGKVDLYLQRATEDLARAVFVDTWEHVPDGAAEGEVVCSVSCVNCDRRQKDRCTDPACFKVRTLAWKAEVLAEASAATGIPALGPAEYEQVPWGNKDLFYSSQPLDVEALERALAETCQNLRLAWPRYASDTEMGPEAYPDLRYVCVYSRGKSCRCRQGISQEQEKAEQEAERARKRAVATVKQGALETLKAALDAGETSALRALLVETGSWAKKQEHREIADRERIVHKLAKLVVDEMCNWSTVSAAEAENTLAEWRRSIGLDGAEKVEHPLADVRRRVARIARWIESLDKTLPTPEMVQGNLDNLDHLVAELDGAQNEEADVLREAIALDLGVLQMLLPVARAWDHDDFSVVSWLVHTPPGDVNFRSNLEAASANAVRYALALVAGQEGHKTRTDALRRRLRALEAG